jgi:hypothetical protein
MTNPRRNRNYPNDNFRGSDWDRERRNYQRDRNSGYDRDFDEEVRGGRYGYDQGRRENYYDEDIQDQYDRGRHRNVAMKDDEDVDDNYHRSQRNRYSRRGFGSAGNANRDYNRNEEDRYRYDEEDRYDRVRGRTGRRMETGYRESDNPDFYDSGRGRRSPSMSYPDVEEERSASRSRKTKRSGPGKRKVSAKPGRKTAKKNVGSKRKKTQGFASSARKRSR